MKTPRSLFSVFCVALCVASLLSFSVFAGDEQVWRPIEQTDLALKEPRVEKDADAEAIFWEVRLDDSSSDELAMNHYVRVKIFTERGREKFSKIDVPFVKGIKVKNVMARVIKADGSIVELKKEDVFEREIIKADGFKVKAKSFAVPGIEPGVIVEYRYREVIDDGRAVGMSLVLQRDIPIQNLSYYYKPYTKKEPTFQNYPSSNDTKFVKDKNGYYLASRTNVPAFKQEPRMPPADQVRPWMLLQGMDFNITGFSNGGFSFVIKDPSNPTQYWGSVSAQRAGFTRLIGKPANDVKKAAADITGTAATPDEKLKKLYEFCQAQIRNVSFDRTITDEERKKLSPNKTVSDVLKRKTGTARDIDLLFGSMASALGLEARPAFSGNRSRIFFKPEMTNEYFIHFAAIAVKVGENWKFYNPGTPFLPYGSLVWYEEDVWAMVVGESNYQWVRTPMSGYEKTVVKRTGKFKLLEDGTLEGDAEIKYTGHFDIAYKLENADDTPVQREDSFKEEIKNRITNAELSNIVIENVADQVKPLTYKFKVKIPNYAQKTGKRLFLQPNFFEFGSQPVFQTTTRKNDVYFSYPWAENDDITIELPAGFVVESGDSPGLTADAQKISSNSIDIKINKEARTIVYNRKFHFGGGDNVLFPVSSYSALKGLFDAFHKADTHSLALKQEAATAAAQPK